jgi:RNA polymerase sigma-70 factor, ECF subfamily
MRGKEGERQATFLRHFAKHQAEVHAFVRSLVQRREDATEIMQDVAVVLWEKFDQFDPSLDFRKWACGVARYEVLSYFRDRARNRLVFDEQLLTMLATESIDDPHAQQRQEALEQCLQRLPEPDRKLLQQAYTNGGSIKGLAEERQQTSGSLYKFLHRLRMALMKCIEKRIAMGELQ